MEDGLAVDNIMLQIIVLQVQNVCIAMHVTLWVSGVIGPLACILRAGAWGGGCFPSLMPHHLRQDCS